MIVGYYRSIYEGRALSGAGLSLAIWLLDFGVIVTLIKIDLTGCIPYAMGTALGTYLCIKRK